MAAWSWAAVLEMERCSGAAELGEGWEEAGRRLGALWRVLSWMLPLFSKLMTGLGVLLRLCLLYAV